MGMELGVRILDAIVVILLARYLAPEGFGLLVFAISFAALFGILPGFGMGTLNIRNVARDPDQLGRFLTNGLLVKAILAGVTLAILWAVSLLLQHSPDRRLIVMIAGLLMITETNVKFLLSFFQAMEKMTTVASVNVAVRAGWLFSSLLVMLFHGGIIELLAIRLAVNVIGFLIALILVHFRLHPVHWNFDPKFSWQILKASVPFALFRVWMDLYSDVDMVMLSTLRGDIATSLYAAAQKTLRVFSFIPAGFSGANMPEMARSSRESPAELAQLIAKRCKFLMMISLPIAGGMCVIADWVILLLFGAEYKDSAIVLRIAVWSLVFTFMNGTLLAAIAAVNQEKKGSHQLFVGLLFSALSNLAVIPLFGPAGAACTTVMARTLIFSMEVRLLKKNLPELKFREVGKLSLITGLMVAAGTFARPLGLVPTVLISAGVYAGLLVITGTTTREEWKFFMKLFRRKDKL